MASPPPPRVAVVGAGLAGAAAATTLASRGAAVTVYDAGLRCPGGRASARPGVADHGCQTVAPTGADVETLLTSLQSRGAAARWTDGTFGALDVGSGFRKGVTAAAETQCIVPLTRGVWVGTPSAAALAAGLLSDANITIRQGHRVVRVAAASTAGPFDVTSRPPPPRGAVDGAPSPPPPSTSSYDAVVLADASVVARPGGAASVEVGGAVASSTVAKTLATSRRAPLFTAAVTLPGALTLPFDGAVVVGSADVAAIVVDSAKPGRDPPSPTTTTLVVVSTPSAGADLTAASPPSAGRPSPAAQAAAAQRLWSGAAAALAAVGVPSLPPPTALAAQRWGAGVETAGVVAASHAREGRLVGCGDLFRGGSGRTGADAALASGVAAGEGLARELGLV